MTERVELDILVEQRRRERQLQILAALHNVLGCLATLERREIDILIVVDGGDDSRLHLVNIVAHLHAVAIELNALRE